MTFSVKYRAKDGSIAEEVIEAADRADCFSKCKSRGIAPMSVREGPSRNKKNNRAVCKAEKSNHPNRGKYITASLVGLLIMGIWTFVYDKETVTTLKDKKNLQVPKRDVSTNIAHSLNRKPAKITDLPPKKPQQIGEVRDGKILLPSGRLHTIHSAITVKVERVTLVEKTFKHETDCLLAQMLIDDLGTQVVGDSNLMFDGFSIEFRKALKDPIIYDKEDPPDIKELKMGVQALRQELKERMEAGEDIDKILAESRAQMQEIGLYKQEIEDNVIRMAQDGMSQADYEDLVAAANKLLAERGSGTLELPSLITHAVRLREIAKSKGDN